MGWPTETEFSVLCVNVGINIAAECWAAGLTKHDPKLAAQIERVARKRVYAVKMRRKAAVQIASRAGYTLDEWSRDRHAHAGNWLVNCVVEACPGMFELVETGKKQYLALSEDMRERAERAIEEVIARTLCRSRRRSLRRLGHASR